MRILHIGSGYPPIAGGGLTRYAFDLMAAQAEAGHEVSYLCSGDVDLTFALRARRWRQDAVQIFELVNPRIDAARRDRRYLEIADPPTERLFIRLVAEAHPAVAHFHSLQNWPASIPRVLASQGVPSILTVQNFHALCPTTRIYDEVADECCEDFAQGRRCVRCLAARPSASKARFVRRFRLDVLAKHLPAAYAALRWLKRFVVPGKGQAAGSCIKNVAQLPEADKQAEMFRRRRQAFIDALNKIDLVVGMSRRVTNLLIAHGVEPGRTRTLMLVLRTPELPLRFGLLNKLTHLKGADVLREAFAGLDPRQVRLLIFGLQSEAGVTAVRPLVESGVAELRGAYERSRMNDVLGGIDVGLVPSILEEALGYVGLEFLAAGIPVLGSRIGGIPDYVEDGVNGFLLPPRDAAAWRAKIAGLAAKPEEIAKLAAGIKPVKTMSEHLVEIERLYAEAAGLRRNRES